MTAQLEPEHWLPPAKGKTVVADEIFSRCDGLDGAVDGVINNYFDCNYLADPTTNPGSFDHLMCEGRADTGADCLSAGQIETLEYLYSGFSYPYELEYGRDSYVGWGTGLERTNWILAGEQPVEGSNGSERLDRNHTAAFNGDLDPAYSLVGKSLGEIREATQRLSEWTDVPPDISGWIHSGGKLLMTTSASDTSSNPRAQMGLYQRWLDAHGRRAVDDHVKYYILPHQDHGTGEVLDANGVAIPGRVDLQGALVDWVENDIEPGGSIIAYSMSASAPFAVTATKPVCAYPMYPHYKGWGALTDAANYYCAAPAGAIVVNEAAPKITGNPKVGSRVDVNEGRWSVGNVRFTYRWLRDGVPIAGATRQSYKVTAADAAAHLTVTVTASANGHIDGVAVSGAVKIAGKALAIEPKMKQIHGGSYLMGSPESELSFVFPPARLEHAADESPQREVVLPDFRLAQNGVTVAEYAAFVRATNRVMAPGCSVYSGQTGGWIWDAEASWSNPGFAQTDDHPVACVTWADASDYAHWLSAQTGDDYRLPSESEWEYAARAGAEEVLPWDAPTEKSCHYLNAADVSYRELWPHRVTAECSDGYLYTAPVGSFKKNTWGLSDMLGNVYEWVGDCWAGSYDLQPSDGSIYTAPGCATRGSRGGSWHNSIVSDVGAGDFLRLANRLERDAGDVRHNQGFRLAMNH